MRKYMFCRSFEATAAQHKVLWSHARVSLAFLDGIVRPGLATYDCRRVFYYLARKAVWSKTNATRKFDPRLFGRRSLVFET